MSEVDFTDLLNDSASEAFPDRGAGGELGRTSIRPRSPNPAATAARSIIGNARIRKSRLKSLTHRHKIIIGLHLQGKSSVEIARVMGCSATTVSSVVGDPLAQEVIKHYYEGIESELKALMPKAVDAIRGALNSQDTSMRLKGVDRFAKLSGIGEQDRNAGVTVNVIQTARERFVDEVRSAYARVGDAKKIENSGRGKVVEEDFEVAAE